MTDRETAPAASRDEVMREALAPCPFCGGEAKLVEGEESAFVQCLDMKMHRALWADGDNAIADEVRDQWNRRAALSHQPGERSASEKPSSDDLVDHMIDRFLAWRLPGNFNPDAGISFKAEYNENTAFPMKHEPTGTNLFDYNQAKAMVLHMLEGAPPASDIARTDAEPIGEEPVAWRWRMGAEWNYTRIKPDPYASGEVQPLYARPAQPSGDALREALTMMVEEKCDYMRINNLGDPEAQHTVKIARAALASPTLSRQEVAQAERERIAELVDTFADEADHEAICAGNYLVGEHRSAERMANRIAAAIRSLPDADTEGR